MEPFPVTCETCRARLKVRSESVIGQIHGCPKCGSMVHIVPPLHWNAGDAMSPAAEAASPAAAVSVPDATSEELPAADSVAADAIVAAAASTAAWSPLVLAGAIGAVLLVGAAIGLAIWPSANTAAVESTPVSSAAALEMTSERVTLEVATTEKGDIAASDDDEAVRLAQRRAVTDAEAIEPPTTSTVAVSAADSGETAAAEPTLPGAPPKADETADHLDQPVAPADVVATDEPAEQDERSPILRFDPLDFDPSQLSLSTSTSTASNASSASVPEDSSDEENAVAGSDSDPVDMDAADSLSLPEPINPPITVRLGPVAVAAGEQHKVSKRLALPLESLEIASTPLARFLDILSDMAGVPITLDPIAFELAGMSPRTVVAARANDVTLEELLKDTLSNHRLEFQERDGQILITLARGDRRLTRDYSLEDLLESGQADAETVARTIETFVAPTTWETSGGAGKIQVDGSQMHVDQAKRVHHELLIFCERLRVARGQSPKSRYPVELLSVESPYAQLQGRLDAPTTFTLLPWTRLRDVVSHWQNAAGVTILVDWRALADVQLGPETPISCSAIDRPWSEALTQILEQLHLGWYAVDGETIAITSQDELDNLERVEFYAVPKTLGDQFASAEALVDSLRDELQDNSDVSPTAAAGARMELDGPSGRLICRGTPAVHRYLTERLSAAAK